MRATSRKRTLEPSVLARSTMLPNSSAEVNWPFTTTVAETPWPATLGSSPMVPEDTCTFCARMAATTSAGDRLTPCSYTHLRAHETVLDLVCRLLLEKKK